MSLLMATTILALGGLGLYMYKSDEGEEKEYDENSLFSSNFWGSNDENSNDNSNENIEEDENLDDIDYPKRRTRSRSEKKYKKTGGTKRRY